MRNRKYMLKEYQILKLSDWFSHTASRTVPAIFYLLGKRLKYFTFGNLTIPGEKNAK